MPRLSILIPSLGAPQEFESTLASVLQNRPADVEVLVAHAAEYHDPYKLGGEVCFLPVPAANGIAALLNAGFEAARSPVIHVVQPGLQVKEDWIEPVLAHFEDDSIASIAAVICNDSGDRIVSAGLGYSRSGNAYELGRGKPLTSRGTDTANLVGPTLATGFYRRAWWRQVRWDESLTDSVSAANFSLTLARLGATSRLDTNCILRDEQPLDLAAREPLGYTSTREAERLYWMHREVPSTATAVAWRITLALLESLLALPSPRALTGFVGRLQGLLGRTSASEYQQRIAELAEKISAEQAEATLSLEIVRGRQAASRNVGSRRAA